LIDVVKIIISKHTPEKQQRSSKEAAKKQKRSSKEEAKKQQRRSKEAEKKQQRSRKEEAKHNDILRFVPFHHPTHHLHWAYDGLDIVVLL
jgi:septal ring factor EnvC (AmiA/AmiB activator)